MTKKVVSAVLAALMAATTIAGCGSTSTGTSTTASSSDSSAVEASAEDAEDTEEAAAPASDYTGTVRWLNYKPEVADQMQEVAAAYTEETGIAVSIETAASNQYESTLTARIDSSDAPTIFVVDSTNMLNNWIDYCADLSGTELYSFVSDDSYTMGDGNGTIYSIGFALEGWGIIVNKAITDAYFASPNKSTEYTSLDDLYTFEALKAVVEDMTALKDELGILGVFGSTSLKAGDDWRYQTHLMNIPLYWEWGADVDVNGEIPEFTFEYADNFRDIMDLYLNNSVTERTLVGTKTVDDSMAEFALGQCAMIQNGDWAWSTIESTEGKTINDEDVCFIPITIGVDGEENMGLSGGATQFFCINAKASEEDQQAAADFLAWLFSSDTGKTLVSQTLQFVTPYSTMSDAVYTNHLFASESEIAAAGKVGYIAACNLIPDQTWKDDFGASLLMYAQGQKEWEDVVADAVSEWATEREITNAANGY